MSVEELYKVGEHVTKLLLSGNFKEAAELYGYALSFDRPNDIAIKEDFEDSLNECIGSLSSASISIDVKKFDINDIELNYLIECNINLKESSGILVELIQSVEGSIYIEQISSYHLENHA